MDKTTAMVAVPIAMVYVGLITLFATVEVDRTPRTETDIRIWMSVYNESLDKCWDDTTQPAAECYRLQRVYQAQIDQWAAQLSNQ